MPRLFDRFYRDEDGATTVDWVLLTAGVMSLSLAVLGSVSSGTETVTNNVSSTVAARPLTVDW